MAAVATPYLLHSQRTLVVSGDARFRQHVMENSGTPGQLSEEAFGGAHALARLAEFPYDNVLLDCSLPDLDSKEVAELIRKRYPQTEVSVVDSQSGWKK